MSEMSDYLEDETLDHLFGEGGANFTPSTTLFVALTTAIIADNNTGATITEVANSNGYSRQAYAANVASGGSLTSNGAITFTASGGNWGTITSWCIVDSGTHGAGNMYVYDNDLTDTTINDGDSLQFADTAITISLD